MDVGKIPTLIGAEVVQAPYNFNVSRGLLWSLQPTANVGIIVGKEIIAGFSVTAGFINDVYSDTNVDLDNNKAMVGQVKYEADTFSVAGNVTYGSRMGNGESDKAGIGDLVVTWDPLDDLSLWLNFDVFWFRGNEPGFSSGTEIDGTNLGVALAGRYAITDRWGAALRFEWLRLDAEDYEFDDLRDLGLASGDDVQDFFEFTFTSDFALTNHLQLRGEIRYDWTSSDFRIGDTKFENYYFNKNGNLTRDDQVVALAELIYSF
jgi:hypothetical protein